MEEAEIKRALSAYLTGSMTEDEEAEFVAYAMDKPEIHGQVEAEMLLRRAAALESSPFIDTVAPTPSGHSASYGWAGRYAAGLIGALALSLFLNVYQWKSNSPRPALAQANAVPPVAEFRRSRSSELIELNLSLSQQSDLLFLKLEIPNTPVYEFRLDILDAQENKQLFSIAGIESRSDGFVYASLPVADLKTSTYKLDLTSERGLEQSYVLHLTLN